MYTTTFYSFKGGVGRSMALANVAVELANRGRRVLAVDFDLEAPGLDTFDVLRPATRVPGIIDFVGDYLDSNKAPDVSRYLSVLPDAGDGGGELWIMPSGVQDAAYAAHYNQIDWADLYERRDGYILFEDLKAQWKQIVNPDYVLIDSRTGHTDTGGICTRQLPDAVAILFFPNEQNLRGLTKVVKDIRAETSGPLARKIHLHFVMSNVPDLDDEDRILHSKIAAFGDQLGFSGEPLVVHRYDSLSLLNQSVFAKDRPRSRLAKEYRQLVREIVGRNLADRDGALDYIKR
ncbi:MAG: AAA family ATPase, partial [Gammaproteobacteria bacterium]|nr:AAA family ATPase [Gammaproteobacteria bacterium]